MIGWLIQIPPPPSLPQLHLNALPRQGPNSPSPSNRQCSNAGSLCKEGGGGGGRDVEALNWSENYYKLSLWYFLWIIHQLYAVHWENITNCENTSWVITTWIITTHQSEQHHYLQLHHLLNKQLQEFLRSQIKKKKDKSKLIMIMIVIIP